MSLNVATLEVLVAKGLSAADILDVARAMEVRSDPTATQRKRDQRAREKAEREALDRDMSRRDVTRDTPPNDIYSNPPPISPDETIVSSPPKRKSGRKPVAMHALPEGWEPVLTPAAQSVVDGWPPGWLEARIAEFRDHASDKGRKSKDWQAAFRKWLSNADEWQRERQGKNGQDRGSRAQRGGKTDAWTAVLRDVAEQDRGHNGSEDGGGMPLLASMG